MIRHQARWEGVMGLGSKQLRGGIVMGVIAQEVVGSTALHRPARAIISLSWTRGCGTSSVDTPGSQRRT